MSENIAKRVYEILDWTRDNVDDPRGLPASVVTDDLLRFYPEFDGARHDDVYPNVLAWMTREDHS